MTAALALALAASLAASDGGILAAADSSGERPAEVADDVAQLADAGIYPVAGSVLCGPPVQGDDGEWNRCPHGDFLDQVGWHVTPKQMLSLGVEWANMANTLHACEAVANANATAESESGGGGFFSGFWPGVVVGSVGTVVVAVFSVLAVLRLEGK